MGDEAVGPAGPAASTRMDGFTDAILSTGLIAMVGKAERGPEAIAAIARHKAAYLIAVGGAAYLVSKAIESARVWRSRTSAWKPSTSSRSRRCRSPWRSPPTASAYARAARPSGRVE